MSETVVVLGAGTGGLVAATKLRKQLGDDHRVVVVERSTVYTYAPSLLWVLDGTRAPKQVTKELSRLSRRGIELISASVEAIDLDKGTLETTGGTVGFDQLVVALGAELAPTDVAGFDEAAHNLYSLEGARDAQRALSDFEGGRVAVMVSRLPYKCPAAPYEAAFLTEALLRKRGVRGASQIDIYTPEPLPMPTAGPELGKAVAGMLAARGIGFHSNKVVERVEAPSRRLIFEGGTETSYDLLLGVPAHRAPEVVRNSGLAGESGFIPVDRHSLSTGTDGIYALGDVTAIPIAGGKFLPKAGVFAHAEAEVVAERVAAEVKGQAQHATFDGKGACFVELGDGAAAYASGDFFAPDGPEITLRRPGRHWHLAKVAFEKYWMNRWL